MPTKAKPVEEQDIDKPAEEQKSEKTLTLTENLKEEVETFQRSKISLPKATIVGAIAAAVGIAIGIILG